MSGPQLEGKRLTRTFGAGETLTYALRDVSLELLPGQLTLIMGPSGCGKSTLLAVLSGLLRPDEGQVVVQGADLWRLSDGQRREFRLKHFGFVFQGFNLFSTLTAREQLEILLQWGEGASSTEARRKADRMLQQLGLEKKADLFPLELSGGEKQRVAVARALIMQPAICFADEPTSALDWQHGKQVVEQLHEASRRGATLLVVSHDHRLLSYADQVLHLQDGSWTMP
jgi:putative ABC transport system ATP-binding protein